jgi:hypothetical protein
MSPRAALLLVLASPLTLGAAEEPRALDGTLLAQVTIHERIIVRLPRAPLARQGFAVAPAKPVTWEEKKAPKCIAVASLAGAALSPKGDLDLLLNTGKRVRAKLDDDCPSLDYYNGFYLKRTGDGMICADRDRISTRSGAQCGIDRFRTLVAKR